MTSQPSKSDAGSVETELAPEIDPQTMRPTAGAFRWIGRKLREVLPIKQFTGRGGKKFDFITARQVFDRLDTIVGPGNWESDLEVISSTHPVVVKGGIAIYGVWKWDIGYSNNPEAVDDIIPLFKQNGDPIYEADGVTQKTRRSEDEPLKAAASDAYKRAAVQHGIGRFLYPEISGRG